LLALGLLGTCCLREAGAEEAGDSAAKPPRKAGAFDSDETARMLTRNVGGTWERCDIREEGFDGTLRGKVEATENAREIHFFIFPFTYDEAGRKKIQRYAQKVSWYFRTIGFNDSCTVRVYGATTADASRKVVEALKLTELRPTPESLREALRLKETFADLQLALTYSGKDSARYRGLVLESPRPETERQAEPAKQDERTLRAPISRKQAARLFDHLGREGYFDRMHEQFATSDVGWYSPNPSGYTLRFLGKIGKEGEYRYVLPLGWGPGLLKDLDGLRKVLDGDAGKAMDLLLQRLEPQRKEWEKAEATPAEPATSQEAPHLDAVAALLSKEVGGEWKIDTSLLPSGPKVRFLLGHIVVPERDSPPVYVFSFPYEKKNREIVGEFFLNMAAPFKVIGTNARYTVVTWARQSEPPVQKIIRALDLKPPADPFIHRQLILDKLREGK